MKTRTAVYCSVRRGRLASPNPFGKGFYERRRYGGATWREIADTAPPDGCPDLPPSPQRPQAALCAARRYARAHGLLWPLRNLPTAGERAARRDSERAARRSERAARRDEKGMAEVR